MIPKGTLCELVGSPEVYDQAVVRHRGRFCTVEGHKVKACQLWNVVHVPGDAQPILAADRVLRPIVPPPPSTIERAAERLPAPMPALTRSPRIRA